MEKKKFDIFKILTAGIVIGIMWIIACGGGGAAVQNAIADILASAVGYDPTTSELQLSGTTVTNVQDAIDALDALDEAMTGGNVSYSGTTSGLAATDVQAAIDEVVAEAYTNTAAVAAVKEVDGISSGFDADLVDGVDSSSFLRSDDNDTSTGTITAEGFAITGGKTGYLSIPGAVFVPNNNTPKTTTNEADRANSTGQFFAAVHLPDGATVTSVTSYAFQNIDETLTVIFDSYSLNTTSDLTVPLTTSTFNSNNTSIQSDTQTPSPSTVINNQTTTYVVRANFSAANADVRLKGVVIKYTYTDL